MWLTGYSDEVYAKSVFPTTEIPEPTPFVSVLSLEVEKFVDASLVHVLYGMSKVYDPALRFFSQSLPKLSLSTSNRSSRYAIHRGTSEHFIPDPHFKPHLNKCNAILTACRENRISAPTASASPPSSPYTTPTSTPVCPPAPLSPGHLVFRKQLGLLCCPIQLGCTFILLL